MKKGIITAVIFVLVVIFLGTVTVSYAVIQGYPEKKKAEMAAKGEDNRRKTPPGPKNQQIPGFNTVTPQQQKEKAEADLKKRLQEEQKKNNEKAKQAVIDLKAKELKDRGVNLKQYK